MKNKFFLLYTVIVSITLGLLTTACEEDEQEAIIAPSVVINRTITASSDELLITFIPSESTTRFVYAIGDESDLDNFIAGNLSSIQTVEGNSELTVSFTGLNENQIYSFFARAYNEKGNVGPVATFRSKTRKPIINYSIEQQYLTDNSAAYTITTSNEYYKFDFALGKASDKAIFEAGVIDGFTTKEEISEYTANYFLLDSDTEYTFFVRGYDRQSGQVSETEEFHFTTKVKGSVPSVDFTINYMDLYAGEYLYTPNELCGKFAVFVALKDEYKNVIEEEINWRGDIRTMMNSWAGLNQGFVTIGEERPLKATHTTPSFLTGEVSDPFQYPMETYVLYFDENEEPLSVQKFEFQSPSYKEDMGDAEVKLQLTNITENGAFYEFFPNKHTMGFFYETFDAEWYENLLKSGNFYDGYMEDFLYSYGYWSYCHNTTSTTFPERTAEPGKRYYVFYLPINYNGPSGGWGKLQSVVYETLEETKN